MAQRKVVILDKAASEVAYVAYYVHALGLLTTSKRFINDAFDFFEKLGDSRMKHKPCSYEPWVIEGYRCAKFRSKYAVAYLDLDSEIIICDFVPEKLLK